MTVEAKYKCTHCGKVVTRHSTKQWVKSVCEATGKTVSNDGGGRLRR